MPKEQDLASVCRRLDALILIALEAGSSGAGSTTGKIEKLVELGFSPPEIAQIIGKKLNYVTAVLSQKKRGIRKKKTGSLGDTP